MSNKFPKSLQGLNLLPGLQVRIILSNGASANSGTGGIPYVLTGSLVAEIERGHDTLICPPTSVAVHAEADLEPDFLLVDLGTTGTTILIPGAVPTTLTLTGIIAINLNAIQIIAPVTPI